MAPNKGRSQIKPGERIEPLWSPLIPESETAYQKRMATAYEQANPQNQPQTSQKL